MSTDPNQPPLAPVEPMGYAAIRHGRGRYQIVKVPGGGKLPHRTTYAIRRAFRSKYRPHVGA